MKSENTYRVPPTSKARIALRVFLNFSTIFILLLIIVRVFPQLGGVINYVNTIWVILILAALNILIWPLLISSFLGLSQKISPAFMLKAFPIISLFMLIAFPIIYLVLTAILLEIASRLSLGLVINDFSSALLIALLMAIISLVFTSIFAADDEPLIYQWILKRTSKKLIAKENVGKPGIVFLEIDGLGGKVLNDAMNMGKAPNMKRWVDCGSHKLITWDSDLSSQTSAAQAGILHGNNFGIPAFRWYDKEKRNIVVSSSIKDVSELEKQVSDGNGLMSGGGTARASLLSGVMPIGS